MRQALVLVSQQGRREFLIPMQKRLQLYMVKRPFHEKKRAMKKEGEAGKEAQGSTGGERNGGVE